MPQQLSAETWPSIVEMASAGDQLVGAAIHDCRPELYLTDDGQIEGSLCFPHGEGFKRRMTNTPERVAFIRGVIYAAYGKKYTVGRIELALDGEAVSSDHRRRPAPEEPVKAKPRPKTRGKGPKFHNTPSGAQVAVPPLGMLLSASNQELHFNLAGFASDIEPFETFLRSAQAIGLQPRFVGEYSAYLASPYWRESGRRLRALERAEHRCAVCNADGQLDVHHRCYDRLGFEADSDLIALCRACHERHHGKRGSAAS